MSFSKPYFEPLILGHNSFFGVDHLSTQSGIVKDAQFSDIQKIIPLIQLSIKHGAQGMMMSTHERAVPLADLIRKDLALKHLSIYPLLPYAQKYVTAANEKGMLNVVMDMLSGESTSEKFKLFWNGTKGVINKDVFSILKNMIQVELKIFKGTNMRAVFLHDVFTDLILGLGLRDTALFYCEEIEKNYGCKAAFATKNLPLLLKTFHDWGINDPLVMPHINKSGYWMNPNHEKVEESLRSFPCHVMAMSTLASGYLKPAEAFEYIARLGTVESIVIGASKENHIISSFETARTFIKNQEP